MRIAAASPEACQTAVAQTGEPTPVVIEAARFYLQQLLFRPDANCYRILGIEPTASRSTARNHMRWLLEWLHPDRNNGSWDAVYAERVLKAWREVAANNRSAAEPSRSFERALSIKKKRARIRMVRLPWIERPLERRPLAIRSRYHGFVLWVVPAGLAVILLAWWSANVILQP
jgi:hypothetical protein